MVPYKIVRGDNGDAWVEARGEKYSPSQISAFILGKMKETAEAYLGEPVTPGGHHRPGLLQRRPAPGHQGRRPHRRAGSAAHHQRADRGRARLRHGQEEDRHHRGLRPRRRHLRHLRAGNRRRRVRGEVAPTATPSSAARISTPASSTTWPTSSSASRASTCASDKLALQRLKEAAEKAKIELSSSKETEINLPFITADASGPKHLVMKLTRAKLESLVDDLIQPHARALPGGAEGCRREGQRDRRGDPGRRHDPHAQGHRDGEDSSSAGSRPATSTPTRWWRSAPRSRARC